MSDKIVNTDSNIFVENKTLSISLNGFIYNKIMNRKTKSGTKINRFKSSCSGTKFLE